MHNWTFLIIQRVQMKPVYCKGTLCELPLDLFPPRYQIHQGQPLAISQKNYMYMFNNPNYLPRLPLLYANAQRPLSHQNKILSIRDKTL